ncbi:MAG: 50S ribosomal protein L35 [Microgenomates group bacterium GW2011_GWA1_48_10]|nr:MAG: 50S ribosomal protein L35 [Microgenomates group bacterium GW2011_GWA1_48_10]
MPKQKISKTVKDRFKVTGTGKIIRRKIGYRHLLKSKRKTAIRRAKKPIQVTGALEKKIKKLLGI